MKDLLKKPFMDCYMGTDLKDNPETAQILAINKKLLKERLNEKERKLLLRIVDTKDLICEQKSLYCYIKGFKLGLKIGYEANKE